MSINYTTIPRKDGKNCGNCIETEGPYFGGACSYAGEIGNHYCDMWSPQTTASGIEKPAVVFKKGVFKINDSICEYCGKIIKYDNYQRGRRFCNRYCGNQSRIKNLHLNPDVIDKQTKTGSCCIILKSHAEILKDDPERLSTDFIKKMSKCNCGEI